MHLDAFLTYSVKIYDTQKLETAQLVFDLTSIYCQKIVLVTLKVSPFYENILRWLV